MKKTLQMYFDGNDRTASFKSVWSRFHAVGVATENAQSLIFSLNVCAIGLSCWTILKYNRDVDVRGSNHVTKMHNCGTCNTIQ